MRRTAFIMSAKPTPVRVEPAPHFVHVHRVRKGGEVLTYAEHASSSRKPPPVMTAHERRDNAPVSTPPNGWSTYSGASLAQRAVR